MLCILWCAKKWGNIRTVPALHSTGEHKAATRALHPFVLSLDHYFILGQVGFLEV